MEDHPLPIFAPSCPHYPAFLFHNLSLVTFILLGYYGCSIPSVFAAFGYFRVWAANYYFNFG